jgi:hypothetical protein
MVGLAPKIEPDAPGREYWGSSQPIEGRLRSHDRPQDRRRQAVGELDALTALLERPDVDARMGKHIEDEIWAVRAGIQGEREADFGGRDGSCPRTSGRSLLTTRIATWPAMPTPSSIFATRHSPASGAAGRSTSPIGRRPWSTSPTSRPPTARPVPRRPTSSRSTCSPKGDSAALATVRWNVRSATGDLIRDFRTSYQLVGPEPWRIVSYVNHDTVRTE